MKYTTKQISRVQYIGDCWIKMVRLIFRVSILQFIEKQNMFCF